MANPYIEARKNIKAITSFVRGLAAIDEALEEAGSLEKAVGAMKLELATTENLVENQRAEYQKIVAKSGQAIRDATKQAEEIISDGKKQCDKEIELGKVRAAALVEDASSQAKGLESDLGKIIGETEEAEKALSAVRGEISEAEKRRTALEVDTAAITKRRDDLIAQIEALKIRFA